MKATELYRHFLGLASPWTVSRLELTVKEQRVDMFTEHSRGVSFSCPESSLKPGVYDHAEERSWRQLDSCQFTRLLHARLPRVQCPEHGLKQVNVPSGAPPTRLTLRFE